MITPFGEVVTAMITPFDDNGEVHYEKAAELAEYLADNGSDAILVAGTTGESPTLSDSEKLRLFSVVCEAVKPKAKVIAGTGSNGTQHTVHLTKKAEQCGVDGIMLVVPYYNKPSQEGLYRHFSEAAAQTKLPVMLYNIPGRSAVNMAAQTTLRLAVDLPNIAAVKEASGNLGQIAQICSDAPAEFAVYSGDDKLTMPILSVGGCGVVSVASHVAGPDMQKMIRAYNQGDTAQAAKMHQRLLPLFEILFITASPAPVKGALKMLGHDVGPLRLPLVGLTENEEQQIKKVLLNLGYL